ncbi:hypothetical protein OY671_006225 [Metschnikowia pulcherrima]|nr:hypothetical protein OY671_006225 [Metschnikowia pulcherrima]
MSQKISEMTLENDNVTREASSCKRPGPDSNHDGPILKKASGSKKVPEIQTPKNVSENTRVTEADESAILENKHRQEIKRFERQLIFERQQNVDLVVRYERKLCTLKKTHEAQFHALKEKTSLLGITDKTQSEIEQNVAQRRNKSITEEQSQVMSHVKKGDQSSIGKEKPSKDKNEDSVMEKDYISKRETVWTYLELKYLDAGLDEEPALDNGSALELALKFAESDTDSDEDDDETSMKSFGVDIEDMTSYEFSTYSELQKVLGRLNNKNSEDDEEEKEQGFLADRLIYCLQIVRNVPSPKHDRSLARAGDLVRTFDRAELRLVSNPKKALEKFSLGEILKVKDSLKEIMDEFTQKFYYYTNVKASAINARDKMGEPKVTSSMDKFAQYVDFLEKDIEAFWRNNECVSIVAETGRALNVVKRVEKAVRECSKEKDGEA